jgi:Tol biopolymer transport system component
MKKWEIVLLILLVFGIESGCVENKDYTNDKGQAPLANLNPGDIVFEKWTKLPNGDLTTNIYFINSDGTSEVKLAEGSDPLWSPDGTKILFKNEDLYVINADGSAKSKIYDVVIEGAGKKWENIHLYSWTPDGGKILFIKSGTFWREVKRELSITYVTGIPTDFRVYIVDLDGTNLTGIAEIIPNPSGSFAFSPDATLIAYVVEKVESGETVYYLYTMSVNGSERKILTKQNDEIKALAFSPDGKKLAYVAFTEEADEFFGKWRTPCLFVIDLEKRSQMKLTKGDKVDEFAWSPDSIKIAYSTLYELFVVDLAKNTKTKIADLRDITSLEWSPDGDKILATVGHRENGVIYVVNVNDSNTVKLTDGTGARWRPIPMQVGYFDYKSLTKKEKKDETDYTDPLTKEVLKNPEPYIGKEVTLILDKAKFFPDLDVWGQTVEVSGGYYGGDVREIRYYNGDLNRWNCFKVMNVGPTVNIMGAKAVRITGVLESGMSGTYYTIKAYKVEPIY